MEYYEKLNELYEMIKEGDLTEDRCEHVEPANPEHFCKVCFITNLYNQCSMEEPEFSDETTEAQRQVLDELWNIYCNDGFFDDIEDMF